MPAVAEAAAGAALTARQATLAESERRHLFMSRVRLALLAIMVALVVWLGAAATAWVAVAAAAFLAVAIAHGRVLAARDRARRAARWWEQRLLRMRDAWVGQGSGGERWRPASHLYADDLDVFGRGSLFELLATARTHGGEERLASWLLAPAPPDVVRERQAAARELAGRPDLTEAVAVLGEGVHVRSASLAAWATAPVRLAGGGLPWALAALSAANGSLLVFYLATGRLGLASMALMAVQTAVVLALRPRVRAVIRAVETPARELTVLVGLLGAIERERFAAPALQRLAAAVGADRRRASMEIGRLEQLVARLVWRQNMIFGPIAALMLWATQHAAAIDRWRVGVGSRVPGWLDAVSEFEALAALGTYTADHPDHVFPQFDAGPAHFEAAALAHPLLPRSAVANDVALGAAAPGLIVVSGSNMSGKSTFLRAIGVTIVLAQAGAPVRAARCRLSPLQIGSSIRVLDSLQDGQSRFFAEISRLKLVVDLTRRHPDGVVFLLDEILAGTNSHDRAHGAEALLDGLARAGAIGLVTTHDLALSRLADARVPRAANAHFADRFDAGGLSFDFRLRPGPVRTSNALVLMRSIGLDV